MSYKSELEILRKEIDDVDEVIYNSLLKRLNLITKIGELKKLHGEHDMCTKRRDEIISRLKEWSIEDGVPVSLITQLYDKIFEYSVLEQILIINDK